MEIIQNKVASSGIVVLDPAEWLAKITVIGIDIADFLFHGMLLREKDFRAQLKDFDWTPFRGKLVAVYCSTEAIVPTWAYMLVMHYLKGIAQDVQVGNVAAVRLQAAIHAIETADFSAYAGGKLILKGCSDEELSPALYLALSKRLMGEVNSLMFGEPCSAVPVYKKK